MTNNINDIEIRLSCREYKKEWRKKGWDKDRMETLAILGMSPQAIKKFSDPVIAIKQIITMVVDYDNPDEIIDDFEDMIADYE